jgi:hypothetical protein
MSFATHCLNPGHVRVLEVHCPTINVQRRWPRFGSPLAERGEKLRSSATHNLVLSGNCSKTHPALCQISVWSTQYFLLAFRAP